MRLAYTLFLRFYAFSIHIASFFGNKKAKLWIEGRKSWAKTLKKKIPKNKKVLWFHCASLGEFEQARPLIESIKANDNSFILLSFFSPSGYQAAINKFNGADHICYLPLDTPSNAKKFLELGNIHLAIFTKYEFWYNFLNQLNRKNIPTLLISAIFRPNQNFFQFYGKWFRNHLVHYKMIFLQDKESIQLLNSFGINNAKLAGDTRFDRVVDIKNRNKPIPELSNLKTKILLFGSSWEQEHEFAKQLSDNLKNFKIIIAPHEVNPSKIKSLSDLFKRKVILWSEAHSNIPSDFDVLIIDSIGMLSSLYKYCHIAVIGGGFGKGIHNILEASVYGKPSLFGPNYHKFKEAKDLISKGGAFEINSYAELIETIEKLSIDESYYLNSSSAASDYVSSHSGATKTILQFIENESLLY